MKTIPSIDHSDQAAPNLTNHAVIRMQQRAISRNAVDAALIYGRRIHAKGTTFCVVGRKEVQRFAQLGIALSAIEGVQVLLGGDGAVITAYRSHDLHSIKATPRAHRHH
ncbi:MAG: DUF4258 domain-containing protein [Candidatus Accumulibacter sp. UW20]